MRLTHRGRVLACTLLFITAATVGITTADWRYYEVDGSHRISDLGR